jgi:beta-glucosidase
MRFNIIRTIVSFVLVVAPGYAVLAQKKDVYKDPSAPVEERIKNLLSKMTLEEKIGQMNQVNYKPNNRELMQKVEQGYIGSVLNVVNPVQTDELQKIAIEKSRLGIPLLVGRDIIHGFKTIFPIPLGQAASFEPEIAEAGARIAATEAREKGVNWTFAPMIDISRDARWGRIAESLGEDPYLTALMGAAMVKGFQGKNLSGSSSVAACLKHFFGYGAAEGGRDYNSTNIPAQLLRNVYLEPFKKSVEAGAATVMTSFNDNDGIPASANGFMLKQVLRKEWGFKGFVVSDWASIAEMVVHGFAADNKDAARLSANAGVDMEMASGTYLQYLPELIKEGKVPVAAIDEAVKNILRIKFSLGLFERPYVQTGVSSTIYSQEHLKAARNAAVRSAVLLKNDNQILPLSNKAKIAVIGPMADAQRDQLGTWVFDGEKKYTVTPLKALQTAFKHISYVYEPGLRYSRDKDTSAFEKAINAVKKADVAVVFLGEEALLSGEAHSLSDLNLIGRQSQLLAALKRVGKPVVAVIMAGRPLTIARDLPHADAVLYNFHPGTMGGPAIMDLLFGKSNPSGKLPVTFVKEVGQIPMYYNHNNTGRPAPSEVKNIEELPLEAKQSSLGNTSFYLDSGKDPLFPFGYGLSYTSFAYSDLKLSAPVIRKDEVLAIQVTLKNTGKYDGAEVAQLYVRDKVGSIVRPVKELKKFQKVDLKAGESRTLEFKLTCDDLAFYGKDLVKRCEPGDFDIWVGTSSEAELQAAFRLE